MDHEDTQINDNDNYFEQRFVNSLFAMRLVDFVERRFQIEIANEDLDLANSARLTVCMILLRES